MARHHPRFFTKLWLGMGAVAGLTLAMSTPASAETIDLICHYTDTLDEHVLINLDRQSVVTTLDDKSYGPYAATISDTLIRWTAHTAGSDWENQYTIDRIAGTMSAIVFFRSVRDSDFRHQCRRATQKF